MVSIRAVYKNGQLQPLDPVELRDGEEVQIQIMKPSHSLAAAAADLLVTFDETEDDFDEETTQRELDVALRGKRPLSEIIIEDRREGR